MSTDLQDHSWVVQARCAGDPPDALFVRGAAQRTAYQRCVGSPVRHVCLADALQCGCDYGVWGGLTERERRAIRRRFPEVDDWMHWLETSEEVLASELRLTEFPKVLALVRA